jgi:hypothetical protein
MAKLAVLGCVKRAAHGGRSAPSVWLLIKAPDRAEYESLLERSLDSGRFTIPTRTQKIQDAINNLMSRLSELEQEIERLKLVQEGYEIRDPTQ